MAGNIDRTAKKRKYRIKSWRILWNILKRTGTLYFLYGYIVLFFCISTALFCVEPDFHTFRESIWYCFSVMTTIGFGDLVAVTMAGRTLSILLSIFSILIVAFVPGVVTSYYVEMTHQRANESMEQFLHDLEHLPELSQEELKELSAKVKRLQKKQFHSR